MAGICRSKMLFQNPVITILGCTGTGKSKLAIELAKKFNGEIINADAMQMYKGLDIITNKVTEKEQAGIRHHLLGFLSPLKVLTVHQYKELAISAIKEVIEREKLPIIVGGTFYYVESILFDYTLIRPEIANTNESSSDENANSSEENFDDILPRKRLKTEEYVELEAEYSKLDNEALHEKLKEVDPDMAEKTHPNSRRKILRGIMVYHQHGETMSSIINKQRSQPGGSTSGGPLKFVNSLVLWLQCDSDVLIKRLDDRVDSMLERGLYNEVLEFYEAHNQNMSSLLKESNKDLAKGIFQSIGFKEFREFLEMDLESRESEEGKKIFENGVNLLKLHTRQYAKQQVKWIKNRFLKDGERQLPPIYSLHATDLSKWNDNVYRIAEEILRCYLGGEKPPVDPLPVSGRRNFIDKIYKCECGLLLTGKMQYDLHLQSKNHAKRMKKLLEPKKLQDTSEAVI